MNRYPILLPARVGHLALVFLTLMAAPGCSAKEDAPDATAATPGFAGDIEGLDLNAYHGRVVVLNFWATWCGPCRIEIPALVQLRRDFSPDRVVIIGISLDSHGSREKIEDQIEQFVDRYQINYPIYLDGQQKVAPKYDEGSDFMRYVPTTVLIDQRGKVKRTHEGVPRTRDGGIDPYRVIAAEVQALLDEA